MASALKTKELTLSDSGFRYISDLVYRHCAINLHEGKRELVRARLAKIIRQGPFRSFDDYLHHIKQTPDGRELSNLIDLLSTNLTAFFREPVHFDYLRDTFIPQLLEKKRKQNDRRIRAWSAGCSSGQEAYSIAITLLEAIPDAQNWDIKILASDVSRSMLDIARRGIYSEKQIAPLTSLQKRNYFMPYRSAGQTYFEIIPTLRDLTLLRYLNLIRDWPINGPLDIIFCRNVMIYFDKRTQQQLINRFWNILDTGAPLFTGHSESLTAVKHQFRYEQPTIYIKTIGEFFMLKNTHIVGISDAHISNDPSDLLVTYSLGSCIGICMYDPLARIGGLVHCQLPESKMDPGRATQHPYMFVDTGVQMMIDQMEQLGANRQKLRVKIAGAATMPLGLKSFDIGKRNLLAARKELWKHFLMINGSDVGGECPRNMYMDISNGEVSIKSAEETKTL